MKTIELLAPAKDFDQGSAAILCGADAIYVGAPRFGARAAAGVTTADISRLCDLAHIYGAKVYVAMNTLLWNDELEAAEKIAQEVCSAGADALIIQDMAFLRMDLPPVELHASTQTFNMSPDKAKFLAEAGFSRIVTERALTLQEIEAMAATGIEVEAFVHGAICVCFSGRCYMSLTAGSRSGNRGECSQPCRLPYDLLDENMHPLIKGKHLLSLQDLNLTGHLEQMIDAGVSSFKIEGRLKDMAYVRNTVSWYRRKLDEIILRRRDLRRASEGISYIDFTPDPAKTFSRGATSYYIDRAAKGSASMDSPKSMGEYIGKVASVGENFFTLDRKASLNPGDGICFISDASHDTRTGRAGASAAGVAGGTNINASVEGRIYPNRMDGIITGLEIYRNYDRLFIASVEGVKVRRVMEAHAKITITPALAELSLFCGKSRAHASAQGTFDPANNPAKAEAAIREQISKTGDTAYHIADIEIVSDQARFVPISTLNSLRREAVEELDTARRNIRPRHVRRPENATAEYPAKVLTPEDNVTNRLSERFYRDHGVQDIATGLDLQRDTAGKRVMQTRYCIRRELGWCLKNNPAYKGKLYIKNRDRLYELSFDCERCEMDIIFR